MGDYGVEEEEEEMTFLEGEGGEEEGEYAVMA